MLTVENFHFQAGDAFCKTIDDQWISDNAEKVIRMLPGGIELVGMPLFALKWESRLNLRNSVAVTKKYIQRPEEHAVQGSR